MQSFTPAQLEREIPMGLAWLMGSVMEAKGRQELFEHQKPELLTTLRQTAMIRSTESSNRLEGVTVEAKRLRPLVLGRARPKDRSEEEIVGYRRALAWIHEQHDAIDVEPDTLRELHRLAQQASGDAGEWKAHDNTIIEMLPDGRRRVRFRPTPAADTPDAVDQLCLAYRDVVDQGELPPLLAVGSFVIDLLCIHPFRDGNGRVARLATLLLLYQHGYRVGRYVSLERVVEETKESYYDTLGRSSQRWHDADHDPTPWWSYLVSTIKQAYGQFERQVREYEGRRGAKTDAVYEAVAQLGDEFRMAEVAAACPGASRALVRRVLRQMRDDGLVRSVGTGRGAYWEKTGSEPDDAGTDDP